MMCLRCFMNSSVLHDEGGVSSKALESLFIFREAGNPQDPAHHIIHLSTLHWQLWSLSIPPCGVNTPHLPLRFHPGESSPNGKKQNSNSCPCKKQPAFETWPCWKPTELSAEEKGILKKEEKKNHEVINQHFVQPNLVSKTFIKTNIPVQANPGSPVRGHVDLTSWLSAVLLIYKMVSKKVTVCGNGKHMGWWLLSVKIAGMAHAARRNVKLSAGRQKLCEERKNSCFRRLEMGACLVGEEGLGREGQGLLKGRDVCMKNQASLAWLSTFSCPRGSEKVLSGHRAEAQHTGQISVGCALRYASSYPTILTEDEAWRN